MPRVAVNNVITDAVERATAEALARATVDLVRARKTQLEADEPRPGGPATYNVKWLRACRQIEDVLAALRRVDLLYDPSAAGRLGMHDANIIINVTRVLQGEHLGRARAQGPQGAQPPRNNPTAKFERVLSGLDDDQLKLLKRIKDAAVAVQKRLVAEQKRAAGNAGGGTNKRRLAHALLDDNVRIGGRKRPRSPDPLAPPPVCEGAGAAPLRPPTPNRPEVVHDERTARGATAAADGARARGQPAGGAQGQHDVAATGGGRAGDDPTVQQMYDQVDAAIAAAFRERIPALARRNGPETLASYSAWPVEALRTLDLRNINIGMFEAYMRSCKTPGALLLALRDLQAFRRHCIVWFSCVKSGAYVEQADSIDYFLGVLERAGARGVRRLLFSGDALQQLHGANPGDGERQRRRTFVQATELAVRLQRAQMEKQPMILHLRFDLHHITWAMKDLGLNGSNCIFYFDEPQCQFSGENNKKAEVAVRQWWGADPIIRFVSATLSDMPLVRTALGLPDGQDVHLKPDEEKLEANAFYNALVSARLIGIDKGLTKAVCANQANWYGTCMNMRSGDPVTADNFQKQLLFVLQKFVLVEGKYTLLTGFSDTYTVANMTVVLTRIMQLARLPRDEGAAGDMQVIDDAVEVAGDEGGEGGDGGAAAEADGAVEAAGDQGADAEEQAATELGEQDAQDAAADDGAPMDEDADVSGGAGGHDVASPGRSTSDLVCVVHNGEGVKALVWNAQANAVEAVPMGVSVTDAIAVLKVSGIIGPRTALLVGSNRVMDGGVEMQLKGRVAHTTLHVDPIPVADGEANALRGLEAVVHASRSLRDPVRVRVPLDKTWTDLSIKVLDAGSDEGWRMTRGAVRLVPHDNGAVRVVELDERGVAGPRLVPYLESANNGTPGAPRALVAEWRISDAYIDHMVLLCADKVNTCRLIQAAGRPNTFCRPEHLPPVVIFGRVDDLRIIRSFNATQDRVLTNRIEAVMPKRMEPVLKRSMTHKALERRMREKIQRVVRVYEGPELDVEVVSTDEDGEGAGAPNVEAERPYVQGEDVQYEMDGAVPLCVALHARDVQRMCDALDAGEDVKAVLERGVDEVLARPDVRQWLRQHLGDNVDSYKLVEGACSIVRSMAGDDEDARHLADVVLAHAQQTRVAPLRATEPGSYSVLFDLRDAAAPEGNQRGQCSAYMLAVPAGPGGAPPPVMPAGLLQYQEVLLCLYRASRGDLTAVVTVDQMRSVAGDAAVLFGNATNRSPLHYLHTKKDMAVMRRPGSYSITSAGVAYAQRLLRSQKEVN